ncbi:MAG: hypothetical protein ABA06_00485 [Parcubacteria bacterium C7867-001]|nr:MAG: hypothetical protein ABA06_00485 [Parcubacteria bacterium C7867-001]
MNIFVLIDNWIIDSIFQRFADWFWTWTNKSCFWLAKIGCWMVILSHTAGAILQYSLHKTMLVLLSEVAFLLLIGWIFLDNINKLEKADQNLQSASAVSANPLRELVLTRVIRYLVLVLSSFFIPHEIGRGTLSGYFDLIGSIGMIFFAYFISCTPKPPRPKVVEQTVPEGA